MRSHDVRSALIRAVETLKPGERLTVSAGVVNELPTVPGWSQLDWLMEGIVGSACAIKARRDPMRGTVVIERLANPSESLRTYVSPDRRHLFRRRPDGMWERGDAD